MSDIPIVTKQQLRDHFAAMANTGDVRQALAADTSCPIAIYIKDTTPFVRISVNPYNPQKISGERITVARPTGPGTIRRNMTDEELRIARHFDAEAAKVGKVTGVAAMSPDEVVAMLDALEETNT